MVEAEFLGIAEGGVGIAKNENNKKIIPSESQEMIDEIKMKIQSREIKIPPAF